MMSVLRRAGSAFATARAVSGGASVYGASRSLLCSALRLLAFFVTALLSADICAALLHYLVALAAAGV